VGTHTARLVAHVQGAGLARLAADSPHARVSLVGVVDRRGRMPWPGVAAG
jgi:hypothetical protein